VTVPVAAPEREELRFVVREFFAERSPVQRALELMEGTVFDPAVGRLMADQLALPALVIPEEHGGQGFGFAELAVVLEEMGRVVYAGPFFATTVLATHALLLSGDERACTAYLPAIAAGDRVATLAVFEPSRGWAVDADATRATRDGDRWHVSGEKAWVLDGASADLVLVTARCDDGTGLFAVEADALSAEPLGMLDLTRPMARLRLDHAPATRVGEGDATVELLPGVLDRAAAALACEQAGGVQACLELTVAHARERFQFGRPIGSYQAVRHKLSDMFVLAETARAVAHNAARALAEDDSDARVAVGIAKSWCSEAFLRAAADTIQLHGGIGFTWEHPAHVFFKRAKASALFLGDPAAHRERIAPQLLGGSGAA
jgi:alkylation response protein AidB-like acyl-CoA dehydrogenase